MVESGCIRPVDEDVLDAYRAPFTDEASKAAARTFPDRTS
jgi:hypothetical protein